MRLNTPALGVVGLLVVGVVAIALLQGRLTITEAAVRVGAAVHALMLVDRLLLPLARGLVGERRPPEQLSRLRRPAPARPRCGTACRRPRPAAPAATRCGA